MLLFGTKKIPELFTGLGTGIRNFKKAINEDLDDTKRKELLTMSSKETVLPPRKKSRYDPAFPLAAIVQRPRMFQSRC